MWKNIFLLGDNYFFVHYSSSYWFINYLWMFSECKKILPRLIIWISYSSFIKTNNRSETKLSRTTFKVQVIVFWWSSSFLGWLWSRRILGWCFINYYKLKSWKRNHGSHLLTARYDARSYWQSSLKWHLVINVQSWWGSVANH